MSKNVDNNSIIVSIITPVYNSEKFIADTIESVQAQTHSNWELILTDDCSTDKSIEIIENFAKQDSRIKLLKLKNNSGSGIARNTSIKSAIGQVIAFIDADDLWDKKFLEISLKYMEINQAAIVFSSYRRLTEDLKQDLGIFVVPSFTNYHNMLKSCDISCLTGMYHIDRCQGKVYMPDIRKRQDYCIWLTILKRVDLAYGIKDVLATYRVRSQSVSRNKFTAARYQWYVYRNVEKLSLLKSCQYFCHYAIKGTIKNQALIKNLLPFQ